MIWFFLFIAVVNLALGFCLGRMCGPQKLALPAGFLRRFARKSETPATPNSAG